MKYTDALREQADAIEAGYTDTEIRWNGRTYADPRRTREYNVVRVHNRRVYETVATRRGQVKQRIASIKADLAMSLGLNNLPAGPI